MKKKKKNVDIQKTMKESKDEYILPPWLQKKHLKLMADLWMSEEDIVYNNFNYKFHTEHKGISFTAHTYDNINYPDINYRITNENTKVGFIKQKIELLRNNLTKNTKIIKEISKEKDKKERDKLYAKICNIEKKYKKASENIELVIRAKMVQLLVSNEQVTILKKWLEDATKVYNTCVDYYNTEKGKISLNLIKLRPLIFEKIKNELNTPYNIIDYEIKTFCENVKSCLANLANRNIDGFQMKHKNIKDYQTITIRKENIKENGIYVRFLGNMKVNNKNFSFSNSQADSKLTYCKKTKNWYMYCPQYRDKLHIDNRKEVVACDPGEKVFQTLYGIDHCIKIGDDIRKPILKIEERIRKLQRRLNKEKNKKKRRGIIKVINKLYKKIKGIVTELHNKTALFLCRNYKKVIIPPFQTSNMVSDKKETLKRLHENKQKLRAELEGKPLEEIRTELKAKKRKVRLNARVKFVINMLSHYKFKQQLLAKGEEYGCEIIICGEEYTSKTCGYCGKMSERYNNRIKRCTYCNNIMERDYNGSRNILIKNINKITN